jgi:hypothetical protein
MWIEQGAVHDKYDYDYAWSSMRNREAVATQLSTFLCPSAPGGNRMDEVLVVGAAAGDYGSVNEVKKKVYTRVLGWNREPDEASRLGVLAKNHKNRLRDITDGMSNTILLAEAAGHPRVYAAGRLMTAELFERYTDNKIAVLAESRYAPTDGTGWADPDCSFSINGATDDGLTKYGPKMINAINVSEVYSFHSNGANFAIADGAVKFLSENIDIKVFLALCTRAGGEDEAGDP